MDDTVPFTAFNLLFEGKNLLSSPVRRGRRPAATSRCFADLYKAGKLDLESMISSRIRLADLNDAVAALKGGEVLRQIVVMD